MSFKNGLSCGRCEIMESGETFLKVCKRCKLVCYCSKHCQKQDIFDHKSECKEIAALSEEVQNYEKSLREFRLDEKTTVNLFNPPYAGQFWVLPGGDNLDLSPKKYIKMKRKLAELTWEIADRYQSFRATFEASKHLIDILRLDYYDMLQCRQMLAWMMLYMGETQKAYDLIKWWILYRFDTQSQIRMTDKLHQDTLTNEDMKEYLLKILPDAVDIYEVSFLLGLFVVKWNVCNELNKSHTNSRNNARNFRSKKMQVVQMIQYLELINHDNQHLLKALIDPKPLLKVGFPQYVEAGGMSEAAEVLKYSWRYIHSIEDSDKMIASVVYPVRPLRRPYPSYDIKLEESPKPLEDRFDKIFVLSMIPRRYKEQLEDD